MAQTYSSNQRNPFQPYVPPTVETPEPESEPARKPKRRPRIRPRQNISPLERYGISQLKLVGIVWDVEEPRAMVEDPSGLGYVVKVGTPIGENDGKIKSIEPAEVIVEEREIGVDGATKTREIRLKLHP